MPRLRIILVVFCALLGALLPGLGHAASGVDTSAVAGLLPPALQQLAVPQPQGQIAIWLANVQQVQQTARLLPLTGGTCPRQAWKPCYVLHVETSGVGHVQPVSGQSITAASYCGAVYQDNSNQYYSAVGIPIFHVELQSQTQYGNIAGCGTAPIWQNGICTIQYWGWTCKGQGPYGPTYYNPWDCLGSSVCGSAGAWMNQTTQYLICVPGFPCYVTETGLTELRNKVWWDGEHAMYSYGPYWS
jgi:hypothetical protein